MVTPNNNRRGADEAEDEQSAGEERMWLCVIMQAIEDATVRLPVNAQNGKRVMRMEAREWLTKPSRDLEHVCSLADVEMVRVIEFAKLRIEQADNGTMQRLKAKATGGSQRLSSAAPGPADPIRARSVENRVFEPKEAA